MNVEFEAALQYINLESYDNAISHLNKAIDKEMDEGNEGTAMEYRCVLGELLANLDRKEEARDVCRSSGLLRFFKRPAKTEDNSGRFYQGYRRGRSAAEV